MSHDVEGVFEPILVELCFVNIVYWKALYSHSFSVENQVSILSHDEDSVLVNLFVESHGGVLVFFINF